VKNRTAEGPTLSKTKDETVGHPRIVSRVDLCSTRPPHATRKFVKKKCRFPSHPFDA
jgi:hypothetical protein